jgi:acyl-CoA synthetase (AMP-forming)/AMP-acid ligase II
MQSPPFAGSPDVALFDAPAGETAAGFWSRLAEFGARPALIDEAGTVTTYAALAAAADEWASHLPAAAAVVAIETGNALAPIAAYLGCLRSGRAALLLPPGADENNQRIRTTYLPDATLARTADGWAWTVAERQSTPPQPHAELAVLLSTSGSTGNPKLVRLSRHNIESNARAIVTYLGLTGDDRAITTLSFHYSYGMAVLHSHLAAGAALLLTERSVVDDRFWEFARHQGATSLAFVPYHFDLVERLPLAAVAPPSLRTVTQAGGRLDEERVRRYAAMGNEHGWRLYIMYGQTEAAPRMAYLPPEDAVAHAGSIGRAIPGGTLELRDADDRVIEHADVAGEVVYRGPNVMMGYAETRADLARGRDIDVLHTGDIAVRTSAGYLRLVGRLKRFVKLYGLRINLDDVEAYLAQQGHVVRMGGTDTRIGAVAEKAVDAHAIRAALGERYGIQPVHIVVLQVAAFPRLETGKPDYVAINRLVAQAPDPVLTPPANAGLRAAMALALMRPTLRDHDTFAALGGDSLAFMEVSLALEQHLGDVPKGWETMTVAQLEAAQPKPARILGLPSNLLVRLGAIASVIAVHADTWSVVGGATLLLVLTGYSLARFQRINLFQGKLAQTAWTLLPGVIVAYYAVVVPYWILKGGIDPRFPLFLSNFVPHASNLIEPLWFIPAYVQIVLLVLALFAVRPARAFLSKDPWRGGLVMLAAACLLYLACQLAIGRGIILYRLPLSLLHLVALGWCIHHADTRARKVMVSILAIAVGAFIWSTSAEQATLISLGCLALIWIEEMRMPRRMAHALMTAGAASFYIYVMHVVPVHALHYAFDLDGLITPIPAYAVILGASVALGVASYVAANWGSATVAAAAARIRKTVRPTLPRAVRSPT